ncbi:signal recognition particle receptor subunit alpha [Alishewanella longhuensis]
MTKQNKLFSWLGFGKKNTEQQATASDSAAKASEPAEIATTAADTAAASDQTKQRSTELPAADTAAKPAEPIAEQPQSVMPPEQDIANSQHHTGQQTVAAAAGTDGVAAEAASSVPEIVVAAAAAQESLPVSATVTQSTVLTAITAQAEPEVQAATVNVTEPEPQATAVKVTEVADPVKKPGFFARLKQGLAKTSQNLGSGLASLFVGKKIDDELYEELETQLLLADVGMDTTQKLIKQLTTHADRKADKQIASVQHIEQAPARRWLTLSAGMPSFGAAAKLFNRQIPLPNVLVVQPLNTAPAGRALMQQHGQAIRTHS